MGPIQIVEDIIKNESSNGRIDRRHRRGQNAHWTLNKLGSNCIGFALPCRRPDQP